MIVTEILTINGKEYNHTYSDIGAMLRCGKLRYMDAVDPVNVHKNYFEEGIEQTPEEPETEVE